MSHDDALRRPIGWWLKHADAGLDAAFETALRGHAVGRRGWQVLTTLVRSPTTRADLVAALADFDDPAAIEQVVVDLERRGLIEESDSQLCVTPAGAEQHAVLAPLVDGVRRRVATALPDDDYVRLVGLLARLAAALNPPT